MKKFKLIYWISTGLMSLSATMAAGMYIFTNEETSKLFEELGYPAYLTYILAIAKTLGMVVIWTNKSRPLKEWAYAGFFFDFLLAIAAHIMAKDGEFIGALLVMVLLFVSYFSWKKLEN